jgi:hypothetical protein
VGQIDIHLETDTDTKLRDLFLYAKIAQDLEAQAFQIALKTIAELRAGLILESIGPRNIQPALLDAMDISPKDAAGYRKLAKTYKRANSRRNCPESSNRGYASPPAPACAPLSFPQTATELAPTPHNHQQETPAGRITPVHRFQFSDCGPPTVRTRQSLPVRLPYEFATSINSGVTRGQWWFFPKAASRACGRGGRSSSERACQPPHFARFLTLPIVLDFTLDADDGGVAHHQAEYAKHYEDREYEYEHCALIPLEFSNGDGFRLGFGASLPG